MTIRQDRLAAGWTVDPADPSGQSLIPPGSSFADLTKAYGGDSNLASQGKVSYNGQIYDMPSLGNTQWGTGATNNFGTTGNGPQGLAKELDSRGIKYITGPDGNILVDPNQPAYQQMQGQLQAQGDSSFWNGMGPWALGVGGLAAVTSPAWLGAASGAPGGGYGVTNAQIAGAAGDMGVGSAGAGGIGGTGIGASGATALDPFANPSALSNMTTPTGATVGSTAAGDYSAFPALTQIAGDSGNLVSPDILKTIGSLGSAALGVAGANQQSNALGSVADKYLALGQPYRDLLTASYQPGFSLTSDPAYNDALKTAMDTYMRAASAGKAGASAGNPFENPGVSSEALKYVTGNVALPQLNTYRSQLGSFGNLGTNTAGTANLTQAQNAGSGLNAIGYGINQITNPQPTIADLSKQLAQIGF